jgi:hypothetical protein
LQYKGTPFKLSEKFPNLQITLMNRFTWGNANAAICGDYYFLNITIVRNKICIYIKIPALVISIISMETFTLHVPVRIVPVF